MSFNTYAKRVLNAQLPMPARRSALRSCIQQLTRVNHESYKEITARYEARFHCTGKHATDDQLLSALSALTTERNLVLEKLQAFERKRIRQKMSGKRTLSKGEQNELNELAFSVLK